MFHFSLSLRTSATQASQGRYMAREEGGKRTTRAYVFALSLHTPATQAFNC